MFEKEEEMQAQEYSMSYENGIFKCKYKSGKEFESIDGETWEEIVLPELKEKRIEELENEIIQLKDLLVELYDCHHQWLIRAEKLCRK